MGRMLLSCSRSLSAGAFARIIFVGIYKAELCERNIRRASLWTGAGWLMPSKAHLLAASPSMSVGIPG